jgi:hypothetical protein
MSAVASAAVEGDLDEAILRRIAHSAGFSVGSVYGRKGKSLLLKSLSGYNNAARFSPWIVLIDLDCSYDCAPIALKNWLPEPAEKMFCRIAVRAIEAWLLADREQIGSMLSIPSQRISADPDSLQDPKRHLILAGTSRRAEVRASIVPRKGSGRTVGPLYNATLIEFVTSGDWRIDQAKNNSSSLARTIDRLRELATNQ